MKSFVVFVNCFVTTKVFREYWCLKIGSVTDNREIFYSGNKRKNIKLHNFFTAKQKQYMVCTRNQIYFWSVHVSYTHALSRNTKHSTKSASTDSFLLMLLSLKDAFLGQDSMSIKLLLLTVLACLVSPCHILMAQHCCLCLMVALLCLRLLTRPYLPPQPLLILQETGSI